MVLPRVHNDVYDSTSNKKSFLQLPPLTVPNIDKKCCRGDRTPLKPVDLPKWYVVQRQNTPKVKPIAVLPTWEYHIRTIPKPPAENKSKDTRPRYTRLRRGTVYHNSHQTLSLESFELPAVTSTTVTTNPRCCQNTRKRCQNDRPTKQHAPCGWGKWLSHRVPEDC